jgi:hypothetical protein
MATNLYEGLGVLCGRFWIDPSTRFETCKNQQAMLAGKATHNNTSEEKLFLFREKNFYKNFDDFF